MLDDRTASEVGNPALVFDNWRHAVAALFKAERDGAPYPELVRLSEWVIRTRNILVLDRHALGLELPERMMRDVLVDEQILGEEDDTIGLGEVSRPLGVEQDDPAGIDSASPPQDLARSLHKAQLIGEAVGVLMQRFGLDGSQALRLLMAVSKRSGVSAQQLATRVLSTASLQRQTISNPPA